MNHPLVRVTVPRTVQLGELVVAAFDGAAEHSTDPQEVSRMAIRIVLNVLHRARREAPIVCSLSHTA